MLWRAIVLLLAGLWMIVAPFVLGHANSTALYNDVVVGVIVALLAAWSAGEGYKGTHGAAKA